MGAAASTAARAATCTTRAPRRSVSPGADGEHGEASISDVDRISEHIGDFASDAHDDNFDFIRALLGFVAQVAAFVRDDLEETIMSVGKNGISVGVNVVGQEVGKDHVSRSCGKNDYGVGVWHGLGGGGG